MNRMISLALVLLLPLTAAAAVASNVTINADAVLEIDASDDARAGPEKTFLIGFIMPPLPDAKTPDGKNGIDELADAGATFIRTGIFGPDSLWDDAAFAREKAWQDAAARNRMHCLVGIRYAGSVQDDKPQNEADL